MPTFLTGCDPTKTTIVHVTTKDSLRIFGLGQQHQSRDLLVRSDDAPKAAAQRTRRRFAFVPIVLQKAVEG